MAGRGPDSRSDVEDQSALKPTEAAGDIGVPRQTRPSQVASSIRRTVAPARHGRTYRLGRVTGPSFPLETRRVGRLWEAEARARVGAQGRNKHSVFQERRRTGGSRRGFLGLPMVAPLPSRRPAQVRVRRRTGPGVDDPHGPTDGPRRHQLRVLMSPVSISSPGFFPVLAMTKQSSGSLGDCKVPSEGAASIDGTVMVVIKRSECKRRWS